MNILTISEETLMALRDYDDSARSALARGLALKIKTEVSYAWSKDGFWVIPKSVEYRSSRFSNPIL